MYRQRKPPNTYCKIVMQLRHNVRACTICTGCTCMIYIHSILPYQHSIYFLLLYSSAWRSQKQKHSRHKQDMWRPKRQTFNNNTCDIIHNSDVHINIDNLASTGISTLQDLEVCTMSSALLAYRKNTRGGCR